MRIVLKLCKEHLDKSAELRSFGNAEIMYLLIFCKEGIENC